MSDLLPRPPIPPGGAPETTEQLDPSWDLRESRHRWTLEGARWRACELAEAVFGVRVGVRLESPSTAASAAVRFHGLLRLAVPFGTLEQHRVREVVFSACAALDPLLSRVPFVYVFDPDPDRVSGEAPSP